MTVSHQKGSSIVWLVLLQICICVAENKPSDMQLQLVEVTFTTSSVRHIDSIQIIGQNGSLEYTMLQNDKVDYFIVKPTKQHLAYANNLKLSIKYKDITITTATKIAPKPTIAPQTTVTATTKPKKAGKRISEDGVMESEGDSKNSNGTASFNATVTIPASKDDISTETSSTDCVIIYSATSNELGKNATVTLTYSLIVRTLTTQKIDKHTSAIVVAVIEGLIIAAIVFVFVYKTYNRMRLRTAGMPYNDNNINSAFSSNLNNSAYYNTNQPTRSNNPVVQSPDYRYNQPLEMSSHTSSSQTPRGPARTESQTPTLVPVNLNQAQPQEDPLRAWELQ